MTTSTERGVFESYLRVGVDVSPRLFFYSAQLYIYVDGVSAGVPFVFLCRQITRLQIVMLYWAFRLK